MPNNWKTYKLEEIALKTAIGPFGSRMKSDCYVNFGVPVIRGKNLGKSSKFISDFVYITEEKANELKGCTAFENDLVFPHRGAIGEVGMVTDKNKYVLSSSLMKLTCDTGLAFPHFIYYFFKSPIGRKRLLKNESQVGTPGIAQPLTSLRDVDLYLPPLPEQKQIASILSALDDKIELNLQMNKTLEDMAMALYKHWFVDFGPFQNGEFVDSELGKIPKGWEVKNIGDNIDYQKGYAFKSKFYQDTGKTIVRVSDTTHNSININTCNRISFENSKDLNKYELNTNDVVIATVGSWPPNYSSVVGKVIKVPETANDSLLNQNAVRLRLILDNELHQELLYYNLKTDKFMNYLINRAQGSASQASVKLTDIFDYKIVIPDLKTLNDFRSVINPIEKSRNSVELENQTLTKTRDTLLPKLISGEVQVKDIEQLLN